MSWTLFIQLFVLIGWSGLWVAAIVKSTPPKAVNVVNKSNEN